MRKGDCSIRIELKEAFVVDYGRPKYIVFDTKSNHYRLVTLFNFAGKRVRKEG